MEHFTPSDLIAIAKAEMTQWGLTQRGWKFKVDSAMSRHGKCDYSNSTLSVTRQRITHDSKEEVIYTLRHEIAHALHYEEYVDAGKEHEFFKRVLKYNRRMQPSLHRVVKPHGAEWKRIARKVGVKEPKHASKGNARKAIMDKWRVVIVNNGSVTDGEGGYQRFPKRMSSRYMKGRKRATLGKLFLVKGSEWKAYLDGKRTVNQLSFYQDSNYAPVSQGVAGLIV